MLFFHELYIFIDIWFKIGKGNHKTCLLVNYIFILWGADTRYVTLPSGPYPVYSNYGTGAKNGPPQGLYKDLKKSTFSEYGHVAYQSRENESYNNMLASSLPYTHA